MTGTTLLHPGDPFPALGVNLPGGRALHLPGDLAGRFGVVLFYQGARYPYCNAQLSAFQRVPDGLAEVDASILALSVNDEATTRDLIARYGPAGPGLSRRRRHRGRRCDRRVRQTPTRLGHRRVLQRRPRTACPQDVIGFIRYLRGHAPVPAPPAAPPALITTCRAPAADLVWPARGHRTSTTVRATAKTQLSRQGVPHGTATA